MIPYLEFIGEVHHRVVVCDLTAGLMAKRVYIPSSTVDQQHSLIVYSLAGSTTVCICEKLEWNGIALGCKNAIHHPVLFLPRKTPFKHKVPGSSPGRLT